jgi:hypothetical protein
LIHFLSDQHFPKEVVIRQGSSLGAGRLSRRVDGRQILRYNRPDRPPIAELAFPMIDYEISGRVDFSVDESKRLAGLYGIEQDLRDTVRLCERALELSAPMPSNTEGARAVGQYLDCR